VRFQRSKRPVQTAADVQGIKLRVPEIPVYVEMARALGTNPTPIPAGEIYTALQTGVVDGMEAPADFVESAKLFEVARHVTRTYHIIAGGAAGLKRRAGAAPRRGASGTAGPSTETTRPKRAYFGALDALAAGHRMM
jgi:hypothetical protein